MPVLFAITAFGSAFLLFLIQPIIAKQILPWFGGSASVWTTCLVFFQTLLLLGYGYSHWLVHGLRARNQTNVHIALLIFSCIALPIIPDAAWKPLGNDDPTVQILAVLATTVGLPYFMLATTSPLIQAWYARSLKRIPYRLFALSNLGSLLGLLAYPFAVEPWVSNRVQSMAWSVAYIVFCLFCASSAWVSRVKKDQAPDRSLANLDSDSSSVRPALSERLLWLALSATGSMLLIAVSNHICQNIASIPFLWIVPLALYLLTFILCFESTGWYRRSLFLPLAAAAVIAMAGTLSSLELKLVVPIHLAGLFVLCMVCHGELSLSRPAPRYLTGFFLVLSAGGVLGGLAVGIAAPYVLKGYFELGIALTLAAGLVAIRTLTLRAWIPLAAAGVTVFSAYTSFKQFNEYQDSVIAAERSFYGALRVRDYGPPDHVLTLQHGAIRHGAQIMEPQSERSYPTSYYGLESGFGIVMSALQARGYPMRVGVIGLGAGTTAAYGRHEDVYRFYDINPQVIDFAKKYFTYLGDSKATIQLSLGDARLSLEREADEKYDVLAIDAFSGDSIPTHLLTVEALGVYFRRLKPDGVLLVHTTNRYLDLPPVVKVLADHYGMASAIIENEPNEIDTARQQSDSDWVIVVRDKRILETPSVAGRATSITPRTGIALWTDDYNNLFRILK